MAITVQAGTAVGTSGGTPATIPLPADVVAGDLLLLFAANLSGSLTASVSGWTSFHTSVSADNERITVFKKTAVGGDTDPVLNLSSSGHKMGVCVRVRGADTATGPAQNTANNSRTTTASIDPPTVGSAKFAAYWTFALASSSTTWTSATELSDDWISLSGNYLTVAWRLEDTAAAMAFSTTASDDVGSTVIFSVAPGVTPSTKAGAATVGTVGSGASAKIAGPVLKAGHGVVGLSALAVVIAPFEHPQGFFSIAFDAPPMTANPHFTKIDTLEGCRVRDWTIDRGRPNEFAKTDVGTAVVRLVDRAGLFDPTNTTSPYYGKVLPGKQAAIALQNPVTGVWWTLFRGFIESWHYRLDPTEQYMELELQLVDGFAILSRAELRVGVDGALPLPEEIAAGNVAYGETEGSVADRINAILGDVNWPLALREPGVDIFSGNVRVGPKAYGPGTSALDCLWDAADAEFPGVGNMFIGGPTAPGHFIFRGRQARFRPDIAQYKIQRRTVGDPSAFTLDEDVVPVAELEWSNGHDNLFNACSATPQGVGTGGAWRPLDPEEDDIENQYVTDPTSIAAHGLRSLTFDNLQTIRGIAASNTSLEETKLFATYYVDNYATPTPRISRMVFKSRRPDDPNGEALWNHLCKCEISDLLTLQTEHPGGGGFDDQFYVEGIHYTGRPGPPEYPIVELSLDVSPMAHYTTNPFDMDPET